MNFKTSTPRWVRVALLACALASVTAGTSLLAQQAQAPAIAAPAATVQAPATPAATTTAAPAPHESALFERTDPNAPTLASAKAAHEAAMSGGDSHTIVVSTLVLVLAVVILVLLIA